MSAQRTTTARLALIALAALQLAAVSVCANPAAAEEATQREASAAARGFLVMSGQTKPPGAALAPGSSRLDAAEDRFLKLGRSLESSICRC